MNPLWSDIAARANITLTDAQEKYLNKYLDLLIAGNEKMNLTRIVDREMAERLHIADALTLLQYLPPGERKLVDIGSGGGVPGIPLGIARPDVDVLLVESTQKKAAFLKATIAELGFRNISVSEWRAEEVGRSASREKFDVATARAVGSLDFLVEWAFPLLKVGGRLLAMKGEKIKEELPAAGKAIKLLGGHEPKVHAANLPGADHHVIVEIPKRAGTHSNYPRLATEAKGKPLR